MSTYRVATIAEIELELEVAEGSLITIEYNGSAIFTEAMLNHKITMSERKVNNITKQTWTDTTQGDIKFVVIKDVANQVKNSLIERNIWTGQIIDNELYFEAFLRQLLGAEEKEGEIVSYYGADDI